MEQALKESWNKIQQSITKKRRYKGGYYTDEVEYIDSQEWPVGFELDLSDIKYARDYLDVDENVEFYEPRIYKRKVDEREAYGSN